MEKSLPASHPPASAAALSTNHTAAGAGLSPGNLYYHFVDKQEIIRALLLWLRIRLATAGHLAAGILLIVVPGGLALALSGGVLIATSGLATGAILTGGAIVGFRALASGTLGPAGSALSARL